MAKADKGVRKWDQKSRELVRLILEVIEARELKQAELLAKAREQELGDMRLVDRAHAGESARRAGFPRSFADRFLDRNPGITPHEARIWFEAARRLRVQ